MKKRVSLGLAMIAGSATMALQAQDVQDTMVVVGSRTPTQISQIPGAVWVIEKEELQQQVDAGADLKTALGKLVPGLDMAPQGRTNFGQNLHGRTVQVLVDGVSLNSSRGLSRQFDAIDPFNIERIEVLSGASSLYGGGATGGIINIITRKGPGAPRPASVSRTTRSPPSRPTRSSSAGEIGGVRHVCRPTMPSTWKMTPIARSTALPPWTCRSASGPRSAGSASACRTCWTRVTPPSGASARRCSIRPTTARTTSTTIRAAAVPTA